MESQRVEQAEEADAWAILKAAFELIFKHINT